MVSVVKKMVGFIVLSSLPALVFSSALSKSLSEPLSDVHHIEPLSKEYQQLLIAKHLWSPECPVSLSRLSVVTVSYYDFKGKLHHDGKIIVLDNFAQQVETIFSELKQKHFPINKIKLTSDYNGDDIASMEDDNTSAFNCRSITGDSHAYSLHAYGAAIDINPVENPYIGFEQSQLGAANILPKNGVDYINRVFQVPGSTESVLSIFKEHGFTEWGGYWHSPIDYQHFQVPRALAEESAKISAAQITALISSAEPPPVSQ